MLMPTQRPCLPPPYPGSKMLAGSTIFFNRSLMTYIVQQLRRENGRENSRNVTSFWGMASVASDMGWL